MRFRTRVFLLFILLAVLSSLLVAVFLYVPARIFYMNQMRSNVLSIAATTAAMISPEDHEKLRTQADENSPLYRQMIAQLRRARNANRRLDLNVHFLYSMRPLVGDPNTPVFVLDAEENEKDKSHIGDIYKSPDYVFKLNEYDSRRGFIRDQWGTWLSASAPIRDASGKSIGVIGADVDAKDAIHKMHQLLIGGISAVVISMLLAIALAMFLGTRIARPLQAVHGALRKISEGNFETRLAIPTKDEFGEIANTVNKMSVWLQQREDLKNALVRYVSEDVMNEIVLSGKNPELYGKRKKVTALFTDLRDFSKLSESLSPEDTVSLLNDIFERMIDAIFKNEGHLNKFVGDGLFAMFGAMGEDPFQEQHAVQAALDIQQAIKDAHAARSEAAQKKYPLLKIGIGINTGVAVVGNIGSHRRMEFTAIGDAINLASRLEQATKDIEGVDILISEYTYVAVRSHFNFIPTGTMPIRGKSEPIRTYTVQA